MAWRAVIDVHEEVSRALAQGVPVVALETTIITGKDVTPYLLAFLDRASGGATVRTNVALATANAALGAQIAVAYARTTQGLT